MSISWEKGKDGFAVAITSNPKQKLWNNKILYCNPNGENPIKTKKEINENDVSKLIGSRVKNRISVIREIYNALKNNSNYENDNSQFQNDYETLKKSLVESNLVNLPADTKFELMPLRKQDQVEGNHRSTLFISGMAGSGKTYFAKNYILLYSEMYPTNKIFFISQQNKDNDPSLKEIRTLMTQLSIEDLMNETEPINWESFTNSPCLVFFDDVDGFPNEKLKRGGMSPMKTVMTLINDLLNNGRKFGISVVVSSHDLNKSHKMETIMKESEYFVLYPQGIMMYNLTYFGQKYLGFEKNQIKEMKENKSRWISIRRKTPILEITEYTARILK